MSEQLGKFIEDELLDAINYFWDRPGTGRGGRVTKLDIEHYKVHILDAVKKDREEAGYICVGPETVSMIMEGDEGI
jgi:hypothetical protein